MICSPSIPTMLPNILEDGGSRGLYGHGQSEQQHQQQQQQAYWPRSKRPRLSAPAVNQEEQAAAWEKGYSTTMECSSSFTVKSLPGFVSAGDVQVALMAANAEAEARRQAEKEVKKAAAKKRPADQQSILGFVKGSAGSTVPSRGSDSLSLPKLPPQNSSFSLSKTNGRVTYNDPGQQVPQQKPAIDPALSSHRLGNGRLSTRPSTIPQTKPTTVSGSSKPTKPKEYAVFSSSPIKHPPAEEGGPPKGEGKGDEEKDGEGDTPTAEPTRSAACLHATTCNLPKGLGGISGLLRRPAGLNPSSTRVGKGFGSVGRGGAGSGGAMDKLRKPFKPLTMNRSAGK